MKKGLSVLLLSLAAAQASAFQAKMVQSTESGLRNIDDAKRAFSGFTPMGLNTIHPASAMPPPLTAVVAHFAPSCGSLAANHHVVLIDDSGIPARMLLHS